MNILTISGSQRAASLNTMLLRALPACAPDGMSFTQLDYSALGLYNQDLEASFPEVATQLKAQIRAADAVIISTPEYNRSIPAPLKNLIDWTSRPYGDSAWAGKPVYVIGATGGAIGTALAQADLRKVLLYLDARVAGQPEVYLSGAMQKFGEDGALTDDATREHLKAALAAFAAFVGK